jgi:hypothetical protein
MGSVEGLKNCQEGKEEIPNCQVGNELRSLRDLRDYHKDSQGISHCQLGNEMRSLRDLENCQEGSESIPYCQMGRDEQMRLSESLINLEVDLNKHVQLTEDEDSCGFPSHVNEDDDKLKNFTIREADLRSLIMIGGIKIFLPLSQGEEEIWVAYATTTEAKQPVATVKEEELEKISEVSQPGEENEHSEECLNAFSQEDEEVVALNLKAQIEEDDEHSEEWLNLFSQETEKTATWEFVEKEEEETDIVS